MLGGQELWGCMIQIFSYLVVLFSYLEISCGRCTIYCITHQINMSVCLSVCTRLLKVAQ